MHNASTISPQGLALKLRAEGKTYKPQKAKMNSSKAESGVNAPKPKVDSQKPQKAQNAFEREETGARPEGPVQVLECCMLATCVACCDLHSLEEHGEYFTEAWSIL